MGSMSKKLAELWKTTSDEDKAPYQVLNHGPGRKRIRRRSWVRLC